jgi:hypothetical protein
MLKVSSELKKLNIYTYEQKSITEILKVAHHKEWEFLLLLYGSFNFSLSRYMQTAYYYFGIKTI